LVRTRLIIGNAGNYSQGYEKKEGMNCSHNFKIKKNRQRNFSGG